MSGPNTDYRDAYLYSSWPRKVFIANYSQVSTQQYIFNQVKTVQSHEEDFYDYAFHLGLYEPPVDVRTKSAYSLQMRTQSLLEKGFFCATLRSSLNNLVERYYDVGGDGNPSTTKLKSDDVQLTGGDFLDRRWSFSITDNHTGIFTYEVGEDDGPADGKYHSLSLNTALPSGDSMSSWYYTETSESLDLWKQANLNKEEETRISGRRWKRSPMFIPKPYSDYESWKLRSKNGKSPKPPDSINNRFTTMDLEEDMMSTMDAVGTSYLISVCEEIDLQVHPGNILALMDRRAKEVGSENDLGLRPMRKYVEAAVNYSRIRVAQLMTNNIPSKQFHTVFSRQLSNALRGSSQFQYLKDVKNLLKILSKFITNGAQDSLYLKMYDRGNGEMINPNKQDGQQVYSRYGYGIGQRSLLKYVLPDLREQVNGRLLEWHWLGGSPRWWFGSLTHTRTDAKAKFNDAIYNFVFMLQAIAFNDVLVSIIEYLERNWWYAIPHGNHTIPFNVSRGNYKTFFVDTVINYGVGKTMGQWLESAGDETDSTKTKKLLIPDADTPRTSGWPTREDTLTRSGNSEGWFYEFRLLFDGPNIVDKSGGGQSYTTFQDQVNPTLWTKHISSDTFLPWLRNLRMFFFGYHPVVNFGTFDDAPPPIPVLPPAPIPPVISTQVVNDGLIIREANNVVIKKDGSCEVIKGDVSFWFKGILTKATLSEFPVKAGMTLTNVVNKFTVRLF